MGGDDKFSNLASSSYFRNEHKDWGVDGHCLIGGKKLTVCVYHGKSTRGREACLAVAFVFILKGITSTSIYHSSNYSRIPNGRPHPAYFF